MKPHRRTLVALISAVAVAHAVPVHAERSIGASFGVSYLSPEFGDPTIVVSLPNQVYPSLQPGLRLGFSDAEAANWLMLDTGAMLFSASSQFYIAHLMGSVEHHFTPGAQTSPYVTLGLGANFLGGESVSETGMVFGGGVGMRNLVAHGRGGTRVEVRYDRVGGFDNAGLFSHSGYNQFSLRVGFDLYLDPDRGGEAAGNTSD